MATPPFTLVIGSKRFSSWSMRPWLALQATGAPFQEIEITLYAPGAKEAILAHSAAGKVPILKAGSLAIWDSLAICEYLAERFPDAGLWPSDPELRATARSVSAEMHSGFGDLRQHCSMDILARYDNPSALNYVAGDVRRIGELWSGLRAQHQGSGDYLFGGYSIADCMYTPVATRWRSWGFRLPKAAESYAEALLAHPFYRRWHEGAEASQKS